MLISSAVRLNGRAASTTSFSEPAAALPPFILEGCSESFVVEDNEVRIGASCKCELRLPDGPALHSIIRRQADVTWIEAVDEATLIVNGRPRRRIALREGDVLELSGFTFTVRFGWPVEDAETTSLIEDLTMMTAEELCDRIATEQAMVDEFTAEQHAGLKNLVAAISATHELERPSDVLPMEAVPSHRAVASADDCERLLSQIRELSELVNGRTEELDDCESELVAAAALLEEAQERVTHQIEGLLDQLQVPIIEAELRASA